MPCNCTKDKAAAAKYVVTYSSGKAYKTYRTKIEADAAAKRIGGKVTTK